MANQYPKESEGQRIGHMADLALSAVRPMSWRVHSLDGTDDVGFDYQIQVVDGNEYHGVFRLQLKGTESPGMNAGAEFLSLDIKLSTLKYYEAVTEPILFVVCDLSQHNDPRRCPAYYVWIHDEVARVRDRKIKDDQKSISIRVPLTNKLDYDFDVLPVLAEHRQLYESAKELDSSLKERMPGIDAAGRSSLIEEVSHGISVRSAAFVDAITDTDTYWPEAPAHTVAGQLTTASTSLYRGHYGETEKHLRRAEALLPEATVLETAAFWYLKGKLAFATCSDDDARDAYVKACSFAPANPKYHISRIECEMMKRKRISSDADIDDLLTEALSIDTPPGKGLAARLLALNGRSEEARNLLGTVKGHETAVDAAIVEDISGSDSERIAEVCREGLGYPDLPISAQTQLHLIIGRTQLHAAVGITSRQQQVYMPAGGPVNLHIERLANAWNSFRTAVPLLKSTGWPRILEAALDAWVLAALYTGNESETLPDIKAAADACPNITDLQRGLERIATACENFDIALEANKRQSETDEVLVRRVLLLNSANRPSECVTLAVKCLPHCERDIEQLPLALSVSITAADIILRPKDAETLLKILDEHSEWTSYKAVLSFIRKRNSKILSAPEALAEFKISYETHNRDPVIGMQLLAHLDTNEEHDAKYCLEITQRLNEHQLLPADLRFVVGQALTTLSRWSELLELANSTLRQYPGLARMRSVRAVALDKLGNTSAALKELSTLVADGERLAIDVYVKIVARLGDVDQATGLIERLLAHESSQQQQFRLVHLLFQLVQSSDPTSPRLPEIAWRIGVLARQDEEMEEGIFVLSILVSNIIGGTQLNEQRTLEVRERIAAFSKRFPTSTLFRIGTVSEDSAFEDVKRLLADFDPKSEERELWQRSTEQKMERGELPVPYSWRPGLISYASNVMELWAYTKHAKRDKLQLRLNMLVQDREFVAPNPRTLLLDITALLVLNDLHLFGMLFQIFPQVAISQQTLRLLQKHAASPLGGLESTVAKSIQKELRTYREQILQPDGNLPTDTDKDLRTFGFDVKRLLKSEQYTLYSDDAIYAIYVSGENDGVCRVCTLDIMQIAVDRGMLSLREMAENVSKLCQWNVDILVTSAVLFAALPAGLARASSARNGAELIHGDTVVAPILESIWSVRKRYQEVHSHMGNILLSLIPNVKNPEKVVASLILVWYWKAILRTDINLSAARRLTTLFVHIIAATTASEALSMRLRSIYLLVIEGHHGARMDEMIEEEAIRELAVTSAEYDASAEPRPEPSTGDKLAMAWIEGTSDREKFQDAYESASIQMARQKDTGK